MKSIYTLLALSIVFTLSGCAILLDSAREFAGYPSMEILRARSAAVKQSFDISYNEAFRRTLEVLKEMEAIIYTKHKRDHSIVAMGIKDCIDTTEVGIFFTEETPNRTTVEIASYSPKAKSIVSSKIFEGLAKGE